MKEKKIYPEEFIPTWFDMINEYEKRREKNEK